MKFDRTRTKPCLVSSSCDGLEEGADPRCADASFRLAHPDICGGGGDDDGGDPCSDPAYRSTHLNQCGDDARCVDPQFALANPSLCLNAPRLILKPSTTSCEVGGSVQYSAVLLMNGAETVLDDGDVTFSSGSMPIAVVGLTSGSATALGVGITTIFATYGLLTATAQLEVIPSGSCAVRQNAFALVLDVSKSSNSAFSPAYATRLSFAKSAALAFLDRMDLTKDSAAIITCGVDAQVGAFSHSIASLREQVNAVAPGTTHTSLSAALSAANLALEGETFDARNRIIVLFSDGENNEGTDPVAIAQQIKDSGSTIIVIGLRAGPVPFRLLDHIATGGFFVNALPTNQTDVPTWIVGLKGYICSGNCAPPGGVTVGLGHLNFNDFRQWNVTAGHVDLIGYNDGGIRMYDLIPGNGNYLDLCGSVTGSPDLGTIECKADLTFEFGKQYRLDVMLAGNQREERLIGDVVNIAAYGESGVLIAERDITITDFRQGFTLYSLTIIPSSAADTVVGKVRIRQKSIQTGSTNVFGCLLNSVVLSNLTTSEVIIQDNFDYDNSIYIEPTCGYGTGYGGCDYGCLESPIPVQRPDPNPLPDQETAIALPTIFTSTKSYTAECEEGQTGTATEEETRTSDISQQDADNKALDAARITALLALECLCDFNIDDIISINLHLYDGTPSTMQFKVGTAAIGSSAADIWNQNKTWVDNALVNVTGCITPVTLSVVNSFTGTNWSTHPDPMMGTAVNGVESGSPVAMRYAFKNLPVGVYEFYVYAHGAADDANAAISISIGSFYDETSGGHQAYDPITVVTYGPLSTTNAAGAISSVWQDGIQFIKMRISVDAGDWVVISAGLGDDGSSRLNGIQVKRVEEIEEIGVGGSFNFSADNCATTIPAGFPEGVLAATDETWNCFYGSALRTGAGIQTETQFIFEPGAFSVEGPSILSDPLMKYAAFNNNSLPFQIRNLPAGTYSLYVYAHGGASGKNTIFDLEVGTFGIDGSNPSLDGVLISTPQTGGAGWGDGPWTENGNYVKALSIVVAAGQSIRITCYPQASANWYLNGFQLLRTA